MSIIYAARSSTAQPYDRSLNNVVRLGLGEISRASVRRRSDFGRSDRSALLKPPGSAATVMLRAVEAEEAEIAAGACCGASSGGVAGDPQAPSILANSRPMYTSISAILSPSNRMNSAILISGRGSPGRPSCR
jgi:hypothetical protein